MLKNPPDDRVLSWKGSVSTLRWQPTHVSALPHNIGFLMKTKMDFRYHADICLVCFKRSHLNGSVFCLYKKRNKAAYSPVSMLKLSQAWRSPPSSGEFLPGKPDRPQGVVAPKEEGSVAGHHLHCSWSVQSSMSTSESKRECPVKSVSGVLEKLFSAPSSSKVSVLE